MSKDASTQTELMSARPNRYQDLNFATEPSKATKRQRRKHARRRARRKQRAWEEREQNLQDGAESSSADEDSDDLDEGMPIGADKLSEKESVEKVVRKKQTPECLRGKVSDMDVDTAIRYMQGEDRMLNDRRVLGQELVEALLRYRDAEGDSRQNWGSRVGVLRAKWIAGL